MKRSNLNRIEAVLLALMLALPIGYLAVGESPAWADSHEAGDEDDEHGSRVQRAAAAPLPAADVAAMTAWKEECGTCHVAFPAKLLPAASWQKIMGNLGDHFGTDAVIDDKAIAAQVSGYLAKNAGSATRIQDTKGAAVPLRITETRWFVREHDEVGAAVWKRASIRNAANCGACHQGAADGNFSERGIRIPKQ